MMSFFVCFSVLLLTPPGFAAAGSGVVSEPDVQWVGEARIAGTVRDLSGEELVLENGEAVNRVGGFSALDYSGKDNLYAAMADRGPDDGAVSYPCRVQMLEIQIDPKAETKVSTKLVRTVPFTDATGRPLTGKSIYLEPTDKLGHRFDPEGFRFAPDGSYFVSDEYGPEIIRFDPNGKEVQRYCVPKYFRVTVPSGDRVEENVKNKVGRASNRGLECIAISHDGKHLIALMQGPLLQDSTVDETGKAIGTFCRLIRLPIDGGAIEEYVYPLDSSSNGNSEILTVDANRFLVIERDSVPGEPSGYRRIVLCDLSSATNIASMETLPKNLQESTVRPVSKSTFIDLLDPKWGLKGADMPEKIEGLTFGPMLDGNRRSLLMSIDNDFESAADSRIWVFSVKF
ncbi:MAG: esterase-like activity of phytase family protein [Planctomycetaceae bacterium]|nr:esterase-like activity of phytase family protein [Planctomycetaceae bacterium]